jgi:hypothetical protein
MIFRKFFARCSQFSVEDSYDGHAGFAAPGQGLLDFSRQVMILIIVR